MFLFYPGCPAIAGLPVYREGCIFVFYSAMQEMTPFDLQPILRNDWAYLRPLVEEDFEPLYLVASDPLIWEQHPNRDRYKKEVFQNYFKGAIDSGGALAVFDSVNNELIGCTRFYDLNKEESSVLIGYTFVARRCWGKPYNRSMKALMLDHAFRFVNKVIFHIGKNNIRSRTAMERVGGKLEGTIVVPYYGEAASENCVYSIQKEHWKTTPY